MMNHSSHISLHEENLTLVSRPDSHGINILVTSSGWHPASTVFGYLSGSLQSMLNPVWIHQAGLSKHHFHCVPPTHKTEITPDIVHTSQTGSQKSLESSLARNLKESFLVTLPSVPIRWVSPNSLLSFWPSLRQTLPFYVSGPSLILMGLWQFPKFSHPCTAVTNFVCYLYCFLILKKWLSFKKLFAQSCRFDRLFKKEKFTGVPLQITFISYVVVF